MANTKNLKHFKKGHDPRRNKKGRPPKLPELDVLMAKILSEEKNGIPAMEAILISLRQRAMKTGNEANRAAEILLDRGFGKVAQVMELKGGVALEPSIIILPGGRQVEIN